MTFEEELELYKLDANASREIDPDFDPTTRNLVLSGPLLSHGMYEFFFLFITNYKQHFIQFGA